jgi:hypothetical protein
LSPETAIDLATAQALSGFGYRAFIYGIHQIQQQEGGDPSDVATRIELPDGNLIIALFFDRVVSSSFCWGDR